MDKEIQCVDCKAYFMFTEGDQAFYEAKGFQVPKRCYECRITKKAKFDNKKPEGN